MDMQSCRTQLNEWLKEIVPYNNLDKYVREQPYDPPLDGAFKVLVSTEATIYSISVHTRTGHDPYLGCIATVRQMIAGFHWHRGNDLPDGPFSRETWDAIKAAMLRYELVEIPARQESKGVPCSADPIQSALVGTSVFYGPHQCEGCGHMIVRQQHEKGGLKFDSLGLDYETYPNNRPDLPWKLHQCSGFHAVKKAA